MSQSPRRVHLDDEERRRRIALRHGIAPAGRFEDPLTATRSVVALHATEPATVHLALQARTRQLAVGDVEELLYDARSLVKQLAMRRTLWAVEPDLLPALLGSASARVAAQQRQLVIKDVEKHGLTEDGSGWLDRATRAVLERLADGSELSAAQLREQIPELQGTFTVDAAKKYGGTFNMAPRVLTAIGALGSITRGTNSGHWRTSRPSWTETETWLGYRPVALSESQGYLRLVHDWLARFGPGTENDIVWWLGSTRAVVRRALTELAVEPVTLDSGELGYVLPGDTATTEDPGAWAALLPVLDPTTMGWKQRDFYLPSEHVPYLFDSNGNGGTTAWWNGRIVGCWVQEPDASVRVILREGEAERIGAGAQAALEVEAARVTEFLGSTVIASVYKSALMRGQPLA